MLLDQETAINTGSPKITIDNRLTVANISGKENLYIIKPAKRSAHVVDKSSLKSLYIEFISTKPAIKFYHAMPGEVLYDGAAAVAVDAPEDFAVDAVTVKCGDIRVSEITGVDNVRYFLAFNAGEKSAVWQNIEIPAGEARLGKVDNSKFALL